MERTRQDHSLTPVNSLADSGPGLELSVRRFTQSDLNAVKHAMKWLVTAHSLSNASFDEDETLCHLANLSQSERSQ